MSKYIVLRQVVEHDDGPSEPPTYEGWRQIHHPTNSEFDASSRRAAIKGATKNLPIEERNGTTFVAVLASEWKPETPKVQVTETYDWE